MPYIAWPRIEGLFSENAIMTIEFEWGLREQRLRLGSSIEQAISRVLDHGEYVMGPEVSRLERALEEYSGARHCISCGNGTDALLLALMALDIAPGDTVFVPAFSFVATAEPVALLGATPFFVDVFPDTFNIDPESLRGAIGMAKEDGHRCRAVVAVDLFGQPADYARLREIADREGLFLIADCCQSMGSRLGGRRSGTVADMSITSFFPTKPLGCYGDGGAVFTNDDDLARLLRSIRVHGQEGHRYENTRVGLNSRLDTIQAAVLLEKLSIFRDELEQRHDVAMRYERALSGEITVPRVIPGSRPSWSLYTIQVDERDQVVRRLSEQAVPCVVCYPTPISRQKGYVRYPTVSGGLPVCERLSQRVLSLPVHPYLTRQRQLEIVDAVLLSVK